MIPDHILDWAREPGPALVLRAIRERVEQGRCGPRATIALALSDGERREVGRLLTAGWAGGGEPVAVGALRKGLAAHSVELENLLVAVGGGLRDLRAEREVHRRWRDSDREAGREVLRELGPGVADSVVERCLVGASEGWVRRAEAIRGILAEMTREGERLPVLAARLFGDAHALDRSRPMGRAVARFLAGTVSRGEATAWADPVGDAVAWREAWASRGVICDEVSAQVLVLNLPLVGETAAVRLAGLPGEPVWLSLRSLRGGVAAASSVRKVFVCENPSIVEAAADRFGGASHPLVCTFGVPSQAAVVLLRALSADVELHVRADEDEVGRRIVANLLRLPNATPWRMDHGGTRYEEELLEDLLSDLGLPGVGSVDS